MKGYKVFKKYFLIRSRTHLKQNFEYFTAMRRRILENSQLVIRYYWMQYREKLKIRRELENIKNAMMIKGRKSSMMSINA